MKIFLPRRPVGLDPLAGLSLPLLCGMGILAGFFGASGAILFREAFTWLNRLFYGVNLEFSASATQALDWWWPPLVLGLGGLGVGLIVRFVLPEGRTQGVAEVIEAAVSKTGRMPLRDSLLVAVGSIGSLGIGASVGREGPVVHLAAGLAGKLSEWLGANAAASRVILGCMVASAVAVSFNATLAGTFFALELVVRRYAFSAFAPVAIAASIGTLLGHFVYGDDPAFSIPSDWYVAHYSELPAFFFLGIMAAALATAFMWCIFRFRSLFLMTHLPRWTWPGLAGLILGLAADWRPEVLGVGYEATSEVLAGDYSLFVVIQILVLKMLVTALCLAAGFVGGVFSPAVVLGAMMGAAFGMASALAMPFAITDDGAYALVGMGAVAGVVLGAPVSTIVMVVELTGGFSITLAVAIGVVVASVATQQMGVMSFFQSLMEARRLQGQPTLRHREPTQKDRPSR
ncbi:MAG: chloride channel protein [Rhodospirillales bacterium]|nr:chloride channel protein [Rhodospirillales bacterium]